MDYAKSTMDKDCYTRLYERLENHPANKRPCSSLRRNRTRYLTFVTSGILLTTYWCLFMNVNQLTVTFDQTSRCNIPDIDPYDPSIRQYLFHPDPLECNETGDLIFFDGAGRLRYNHTAIEKIGPISCEYRMIIRKDGDDDHVWLGDATAFYEGDTIKADFFKMGCKSKNGDVVFNRYMAQVYITDERKRRMSGKAKKSPNQYNVLMFMIDSVSRLNGLRRLKKTYEFMTGRAAGYDFSGYTKIGDNTFPNLVPMFTGKQLSELHPRTEFVDDYPFIWKNFREKGYATMFAEDLPSISFLNWQVKGLAYPPTDHYMRPFWLGISQGKPSGHVLGGILLALENKRIHLRKSSTMCYGSTAKHKIVMDYSAEFMRKYNGSRFFNFNILTEISHDHLNMVELGDVDLYNFLHNLYREGMFEDTFVFVFSDHGHRFDAIRSTLIGRMEGRLPLMLMSIPNELKRTHPEIDAIVRTNSQRLTTAHDVYQTLADILHSTFDETSRRERLRQGKPLGISFFQPIPKSRSCHSALIPDSYCACHKSVAKNTSSLEIRRVSHQIVSHINNLLSSQNSCAKLSLKSIINAQQILSISNLIKSRTWFGSSGDNLQQFLVAIQTSPSDAIFEATANYQSGSVEILGDISRINKYGNQSICIRDTRLKLYCFCV